MTYIRTILCVFFADLLRTIESNDLGNGLNYIMEATYDNEIPYKEEQDAFFSALRQEEWNQRNRKSGRLKIESVAATNYAFVSRSFIDTVVVDKKSAILWLNSVGCLFIKTVKGITKTLVDSIIASETQSKHICSTPSPQPIFMAIQNELHAAPVVVVNKVQLPSVFVTSEMHTDPVVTPPAGGHTESTPVNKVETPEDIDPNTVVMR